MPVGGRILEYRRVHENPSRDSVVTNWINTILNKYRTEHSSVWKTHFQIMNLEPNILT